MVVDISHGKYNEDVFKIMVDERFIVEIHGVSMVG